MHAPQSSCTRIYTRREYLLVVVVFRITYTADTDCLGVHLLLPAARLGPYRSKPERQRHRRQHLLQQKQPFVRPSR